MDDDDASVPKAIPPNVPMFVLWNGEVIGKGWTFSREYQRVRDVLATLYGNIIASKHCLRVMDLNYQLNKQSGWDDRSCIQGATCSFFHDLGKQWPPIKPYFSSPHDTIDWADLRRQRLRKQHSVRGPYELEKFDLGSQEGLRSGIEFVQIHHHTEPRQIPMGSLGDLTVRTAVVDRFDGMTAGQMERPHRQEPMSARAAAVQMWLGEVRKKRLERTATELFITRVLEFDLPT
jgi:hypothetical protein